jgi:hypothetical protein
MGAGSAILLVLITILRKLEGTVLSCPAFSDKRYQCRPSVSMPSLAAALISSSTSA